MGFYYRARKQESPRAAWYDRNPTTVTLIYSTRNVAPHASTSRGSYTVPQGKKAFVSNIYIELLRSAAATTVGVAYALVQTLYTGLLVVSHEKNAVGDREWADRAADGLVGAGNSLEIRTADASTGGTIDYVVIVEVTAFDA